jgi:hypothetical protein
MVAWSSAAWGMHEVNERPHDNYGCKYEEFTRSAQQTMR